MKHTEKQILAKTLEVMNDLTPPFDKERIVNVRYDEGYRMCDEKGNRLVFPAW